VKLGHLHHLFPEFARQFMEIAKEVEQKWDSSCCLYGGIPFMKDLAKK